LEHKEKEIADMSKAEVHITPKGIALHPWLTLPDTKFDKEGKYKVDLRLDPDDEVHAAFIEKLSDDNKRHWDEVAKKDKKKAAIARSPRDPIKAEVDPATGEETGMVIVRFSSRYQPSLFDADRNQITDDLKIGTGSVVKVAFTKNYYYNAKDNEVGLNLYLMQVQIVKLVEYNARGVAVAGFEVEDGGFKADQPPPKESFPTDAPGEGEEDEEQDDLPFDNPPPAASGGDDDPRDELIEKALVDDKKLGLADRSHKAKIGYPQLRELWDAKKGNPAMFRIALNTMLKQKGV
jgi:hypothetical protein